MAHPLFLRCYDHTESMLLGYLSSDCVRFTSNRRMKAIRLSNRYLMRQMELFEIHDHLLFPAFLRDLTTLDRVGTREILDLCSGGGGPRPVEATEVPADLGAFGRSSRRFITSEPPTRAKSLPTRLSAGKGSLSLKRRGVRQKQYWAQLMGCLHACCPS